jgi:hypothetical protein
VYYDIDKFSQDDWVRFVFDHPVTDMESAWYWDDACSWSGNPRVVIRLSTEMFTAAASLAVTYSREQLEQGFWFLIGCGFDLPDLLWRRKYAWALRRDCIASMVVVFEELFSKDSLDAACFMWWDLMRYFGDDGDEKTTEAIVRACERILKIPSRACQRSALHGLGHFEHDDRVRIIDGYLRAHPDLDEELQAYAIAARCGKIQ